MKIKLNVLRIPEQIVKMSIIFHIFPQLLFVFDAVQQQQFKRNIVLSSLCQIERHKSALYNFKYEDGQKSLTSLFVFHFVCIHRIHILLSFPFNFVQLLTVAVHVLSSNSGTKKINKMK